MFDLNMGSPLGWDAPREMTQRTDAAWLRPGEHAGSQGCAAVPTETNEGLQTAADSCSCRVQRFPTGENLNRCLPNSLNAFPGEEVERGDLAR